MSAYFWLTYFYISVYTPLTFRHYFFLIFFNVDIPKLPLKTIKTAHQNSVGADLAALSEVNALTDVTGFGLCGHMYEFCKGANLAATIVWDKLPILDTVLDYAQKGYNTGAADRNWDSFCDHVVTPDGMPQWQKNILMDPQTSGGLLVSCPPEAADTVLKTFLDSGFDFASIIRSLNEGEAKVSVI